MTTIIPPSERVLVPYTRIVPATLNVLKRYAPHAEYVNVADDPGAYWNMLAKAWRKGQTFVIVEHDVEIRGDTLYALGTCQELWCGFATALSSAGFRPAFGCTRFRDTLMREQPTIMDQVGEINDDGMPPRDWHRLDVRTARVLHDSYGIEQHAHFPTVRHHNKGQNNGVPVEDQELYPESMVTFDD